MKPTEAAVLRWILGLAASSALAFSPSGAAAADVRVDDYYDPSDPLVVADLSAIDRAISAAGVGGIVRLTSGRTYTIPNHVFPLASQTLTTDGLAKATLKRADAILTTLASNAASGQDFIDVVHPEVFRPNWFVSPLVSGGTGGRGDGEPFLVRIRSITGNRLLLNRELSQDYLAGDRVVNTPRVVVIHHPDISLENLRIDGNRSNNGEWVSWATHMDIHVGSVSTGASIEDLELVSSTGTALYMQGHDVVVSDSVMSGSNLSCVHLSGSQNVVFERITCRDANSLGSLGGHSTAAFEWSLGNVEVAIRGSRIEDVSGWAFGGLIPYGGNSGVEITSNVLESNEGILHAYAVAGTIGRSLQLEFSGNTVLDSGGILITAPSGDPIVDLLISGNQFTNSTVDLRSVDVASIVDNLWWTHADASLPDLLSVTWTGPNVTVEGNEIATLFGCGLGWELHLWLLILMAQRRNRARVVPGSRGGRFFPLALPLAAGESQVREG